jgi:hypothetical protein
MQDQDQHIVEEKNMQVFYDYLDKLALNNPVVLTNNQHFSRQLQKKYQAATVLCSGTNEHNFTSPYYIIYANNILYTYNCNITTENDEMIIHFQHSSNMELKSKIKKLDNSTQKFDEKDSIFYLDYDPQNYNILKIPKNSQQDQNQSEEDSKTTEKQHDNNQSIFPNDWICTWVFQQFPWYLKPLAFLAAVIIIVFEAPCHGVNKLYQICVNKEKQQDKVSDTSNKSFAAQTKPNNKITQEEFIKFIQYKVTGIANGNKIFFTNVESIDGNFKNIFSSKSFFKNTSKAIEDYCVVCLKIGNTWQVYTYNCGKTECGEELGVYDNNNSNLVYTETVSSNTSFRWSQIHLNDYTGDNSLVPYSFQKVEHTNFKDCTAEMKQAIFKDRKQVQGI